MTKLTGKLSNFNPRRFLTVADLIRWDTQRITVTISHYTTEKTHPKPHIESNVTVMWLTGKDGKPAKLGYLLKVQSDFDILISLLGDNIEHHAGKKIDVVMATWCNQPVLRLAVPTS